MGWLFTHQPRAALIRDLLCTQEGPKLKSRVVDFEETPSALWTVVELTAKEGGAAGLAQSGDRLNVIFCHLLEGGADGWGYKSIDESSHPYHYGCPLRLLDLAPVQSAEWREMVRAVQAAEAG